MAKIELGCQATSHMNMVVEIPSDDKANTMADLPVSPRDLPVSPRELAVSPRELAVVWLEAGPFGGSLEGDLEWPFPEDPSKVRFILRDS